MHHTTLLILAGHKKLNHQHVVAYWLELADSFFFCDNPPFVLRRKYWKRERSSRHWPHFNTNAARLQEVPEPTIFSSIAFHCWSYRAHDASRPRQTHDSEQRRNSVWASWWKLSWRGPTGHLREPNSQHSEKMLKIDSESGCGWLH